MKPEPNQLTFSFWRMLRLSSFQIGSAMGDILVTSIWNRVMISQFGIPAAPVSLLIALRYLLSPLSLWAGYRSDTRPFFGMRRTAYIWLGRGLMVLSLPLLGWSLMRFAAVHEVQAAQVMGLVGCWPCCRRCCTAWARSFRAAPTWPWCAIRPRRKSRGWPSAPPKRC
jgi:hypothetical protein